MRRNNTLRTVLAVAIVAGAIYTLYPTYSLYQQNQDAEQYIQHIESATSLSRSDIKQSLYEGSLNLRLEDLAEPVDQDVKDAATLLTDLHVDIAENEPRAIKRGLDLQGGAYFVYEANLPKIAETLARDTDLKFEQYVAEAKQTSISAGDNFFDVLSAIFQRENISMNRYFGRRSQSDGEIIDELKKESEDAIDRTVEVLRNRVDKFGVSEPSITKQGTERLVIELPGIDDIERAKENIGKTAVLEFKLVQDRQVVRDVLQDIDRAWKNRLGGSDSSAVDSSVAAAEKVAEQVQTSSQIDEILGTTQTTADTSDTSKADLNLATDFAQNTPFLAMLRDYGDDITGVPAENLYAVRRIVNHPDVRQVIPSDYQIAFWDKPQNFGADDTEQAYYQFVVVKKSAELDGSMLEKAFVTIPGSGSQSINQGPQISLQFNSDGARKFARVTGGNVGKKLAILLDGNVKSAPNIQERIPNGSAVITGQFAMQEANDLAIVLRAGALPAPVDPIEERTVGPSLGEDSVRQGQMSIGIGIALVIVFMAIYYKLSGFVAVLALVLNLVLVMAVLAGRGATLTLPGVAGLILTIGIAVDANVLIFERIREELRSGKTVRAAVDAGYGRAFWTIFDANITTLLTALVIYQFGTGPLKGFAFTLGWGIVASMFTAIVVTRIIFDFVTQRKKMASLSI